MGLVWGFEVVGCCRGCVVAGRDCWRDLAGSIQKRREIGGLSMVGLVAGWDVVVFGLGREVLVAARSERRARVVGSGGICFRRGWWRDGRLASR